MRKLVAVFSLLLCTIAPIYGQSEQGPPKAKPRVDYPLTLHISGIHLRSECQTFLGKTACGDVIYVDALVNGKKIELMGDKEDYSLQYLESIPGDFHARLIKGGSNPSLAKIHQKIEFVFPDKTVWQCTVTGISE